MHPVRREFYCDLAIIGGGAIVAANGVKGKASVGNHTRLY